MRTLESLEVSLPIDIDNLLAEVQVDIDAALAGQSVEEISQHLSQTLKTLDGQILTLDQDIHLKQQKLSLIENLNGLSNDLLTAQDAIRQVAANKLLTLLESPEVEAVKVALIEAQYDYVDLIGQIAKGQKIKGLSDEQVDQIMTQLAKTLSDMEKAADSNYWNTIFGRSSLITSITGTLLTLFPPTAPLGVAMIGTSSLIQSRQAIYNGDYVMAGINAVIGFTQMGIGVAELTGAVSQTTINKLKAVQPFLTGTRAAYKGYNYLRSGEGTAGALTLIRASAGFASNQLQSLFENPELGQDFVKLLQEAPTEIYSMMQAIQEDDWIAGFQGFLNVTTVLEENYLTKVGDLLIKTADIVDDPTLDNILATANQALNKRHSDLQKFIANFSSDDLLLEAAKEAAKKQAESTARIIIERAKEISEEISEEKFIASIINDINQNSPYTQVEIFRQLPDSELQTKVLERLSDVEQQLSLLKNLSSNERQRILKKLDSVTLESLFENSSNGIKSNFEDLNAYDGALLAENGGTPGLSENLVSDADLADDLLADVDLFGDLLSEVAQRQNTSINDNDSDSEKEPSGIGNNVGGTQGPNNPGNSPAKQHVAPELRRQQIFEYASEQRDLANSGKITDLEALVRIIEFIVPYHAGYKDSLIGSQYYHYSPEEFIEDLTYLLTEESGDIILRYLTNSHDNHDDRIKDLRETGFKPEFIEEPNARSRNNQSYQVRHFVGWINAGYYWPESIAIAGLYGTERDVFMRKIPGRGTRIRNHSQQDIDLGLLGIELGNLLRNNEIKLEEVADWVVSNAGDDSCCFVPYEGN